MCGIAGFLGRYRPETLAYFTAALAHRGPDGSGVWQDRAAGVGLAHRRLSIIDLSRAASQPMAAVGSAGAERYQIIFNGEIYNFRRLHGLIAGYDFNRSSDTAILGPLYDTFGPAMLSELEGMFALAIWDRENRELWLARDHAGIKPLYYAETPEGLAFASELKALTGLWGVDLTPDAEALADYLTLLWSPGERTPVRGIKKLRPGHWLKARLKPSGRGVDYEIVRWYAPPQSAFKHGKPQYDASITPEKLRDVLDGVVAEQCTSDVPVGAFLSGGMDSSAIVASMVENANNGRGPGVAQTYCIGFDGPGMEAEGFSDDLKHARLVAEKLGVPLTPLVMQKDAVLGRLPSLAMTLDEPTADPAPLFVEDIAYQARVDGVKVLMSGTGGDDVFTGYRRHLSARLRQRLGPLRVPTALALQGLSHWSEGSRKRRFEKLAPLLRGNDEAFLMRAFMTNSQPTAWKLLHSDLRMQLKGGWSNALTEARAECSGHDLVNRLLYMELFGFLPDHNLNYTDKAGMLHGVEIRVPLTDRRLMELMSRVNPKNKLHRTRLKAFFKDAMSYRLPDAVIQRNKAGFGAPLREWLFSAKNDVLAGQGGISGRGGILEDALFSPEATGWYDQEAVRKLYDATVAGRVDGTFTLMAVAMGVWWRAGILKT